MYGYTIMDFFFHFSILCASSLSYDGRLGAIKVLLELLKIIVGYKEKVY